jgi:hypothetical protein
MPLFSPAQEDLYLKGEVKDLETSLPLQDSHVYVSCLKFGAVTQFDGSFELVLPKKCLTESLVISYVGYSNSVIPVHSIGNMILEVEMEHQVILLAEILVTPERTTVIYPDSVSKALVQHTPDIEYIAGINCLDEIPELLKPVSTYYSGYKNK